MLPLRFHCHGKYKWQIAVESISDSSNGVISPSDTETACQCNGRSSDAISRAGGSLESAGPVGPYACGGIAPEDNQTPA